MGSPQLAVRSAARVFTAKAFRPVLAQGQSSSLSEAMQALKSDLGLGRRTSNSTVIDAAYELLANSYRNEYVYKNLITSKIFVGRHKAKNSAMLSEFRVGSAVADSFFLNGNATVYEIKTELDNPDKLARQLGEYYRASPLVNVVVHENSLERYERILTGTPVGLIAVGSRWTLSTVKYADECNEHLCVRTMVNTLRVREMQSVLSALGFDLPDVPNGLRYERYLNLALGVPPRTFHDVYRSVLKNRRALTGDIAIHRDPSLFPLRAVLAQLDPSLEEGRKLYSWLSLGD